MQSDTTVIITSTYFVRSRKSDDVRARLALQSLEAARALGMPVVAVDGGSDESFIEEMKRLGAEVAICKNGMGASRREAVRRGMDYGSPALVYLELEKAAYIPHAEALSRPIVEGSADFIIPRRQSLDSFPKAQQYSERLGNDFFHRLTGLSRDLWFGPRHFSRECGQYFLDYEGEYGDSWESIFIPVLRAFHEGKKIGEVEVPYVHPKDQTELEDADLAFEQKRAQQLDLLTRSLEAEWLRLRKNSLSTSGVNK